MRILFTVLLISIVTIAAMPFWNSASAEKPRILNMIVTGNMRGVLEPCGCQALQPGGLARSAALVARLSRETPSLIIDVGNNLPSRGADASLLELIFDTFGELGYRAANIGPLDEAAGAAALEKLSGANKPVLLRSQAASATPATPLSVQTLDVDDLKIRLVGGLSAPTDFLTQSDTQLHELANSISKLPKVDGTIVISQLSSHVDRRLAALLPNRTVLISGSSDIQLSPGRLIGQCIILPTPQYGEAVVQARIRLDAGKGLRLESHKARILGPTAPSSQSVVARIREYQQKHRTLGIQSGLQSDTFHALGDTAQSQLKSEANCGSCHPKAQQAWQSTAHSHAWKTLVARHADRRADCVPCHTTVQLSLALSANSLSGVSCGSCHGDDPQHAKRPDDPRFVVRRPAGSICVVCHTKQQSPKFNFAAYLPKIACSRQVTSSADGPKRQDGHRR